MIWVTYIDPIPDDPKHIKHNYSGWKYSVEPSGALVLTKGDETVIFGPGFWVRVDDDTKAPKKVVRQIR